MHMFDRERSAAVSLPSALTPYGKLTGPTTHVQDKLATLAGSEGIR